MTEDTHAETVQHQEQAAKTPEVKANIDFNKLVQHVDLSVTAVKVDPEVVYEEVSLASIQATTFASVGAQSPAADCGCSNIPDVTNCIIY